MAGFAVPAFSGTVASPRLLADGSGSRRLAAMMMPSSSSDDDVVVVGSSSFDPRGLSSSESPHPLDGIVESDREWDRRSSHAAMAAAASLLLTSAPAGYGGGNGVFSSIYVLLAMVCPSPDTGSPLELRRE